MQNLSDKQIAALTAALRRGLVGSRQGVRGAGYFDAALALLNKSGVAATAEDLHTFSEHPGGHSTRVQFTVLNARTAEEAVAECRRTVAASELGWEFDEDIGVWPVARIELLSVAPISDPVGVKFSDVVICRPFIDAPLIEPEAARYLDTAVHAFAPAARSQDVAEDLGGLVYYAVKRAPRADEAVAQ